MADWRPSPRQLERLAVARRLRIRSRVVAITSAVVVFGVLIAVIVSSPGWGRVGETFFSWSAAGDGFPAILKGFWLNVRLFMLAEPLILVVGLAVAVARVSTAPVLLSVRILAVGYAD